MENHNSEIELELINENVKFIGKSGTNDSITIDYIPPFGNGEGYTALELLLISFTSCLSITLLALMKSKLQKNVTSLKVKARGERRDKHPKDFSNIYLEYHIGSKNLSKSEVQSMIDLAEQKYCPVWAMIKANVKVQIKYTIE